MPNTVMDADIAQKKRDYDARAKRLLSRKEVIAYILKHVVKEFKRFSIPEIIGCLDGEPEISSETVDDPDIPPNMDAVGSEVISENEGRRTFDIKFKVKVPGEETVVELIINIESQYNYSPGYVLEKRCVYYAARMISALYNVEFTHSNFNGLKKVYTIWICTGAPKHLANTITEYSLTQKSIVGEVPDIPANYDLMSLIMINLGSTEKNYTGLIKLLDLLLNRIVSDRQRALDTLANEFNIPLGTIKEEVDPMCNLSTGIYNNGLADGMAQGMAQGMAKGMAAGRAEGMAAGRAEGMAAGRTEGMIENAIFMVRKLMTEKGFSLEDALDFAELDQDTYNKYSKEN